MQKELDIDSASKNATDENFEPENNVQYNKKR